MKSLMYHFKPTTSWNKHFQTVTILEKLLGKSKEYFKSIEKHACEDERIYRIIMKYNQPRKVT